MSEGLGEGLGRHTHSTEQEKGPPRPGHPSEVGDISSRLSYPVGLLGAQGQVVTPNKVSILHETPVLLDVCVSSTGSEPLSSREGPPPQSVTAFRGGPVRLKQAPRVVQIAADETNKDAPSAGAIGSGLMVHV